MKLTRRSLACIALALVALGAAAACGYNKDTSTSGAGSPADLQQAKPPGTTNSDAFNPVGAPQATAQTQAYSADSSAGSADGARKASGSPAPATGTGTGGGGEEALAATQLDRKIIFQAKLDFGADNVRTTFDDVNRVARNAGGFIDKSSLYDRTDSQGKVQTYGEITVRVPSQQYGEVLAQLRGLPGAKVQREDSNSNEVTEQYTDLQSRQRNLERTEQQYLKLLEQAKTIQEILTVNDRLNAVRAQIEQIQGRLKVLDNLTELATISATISPGTPAKVTPKDDSRTSPSEAFADAWQWSVDALWYAAAAGAVAAVGLIWLTIPAALVLLGLRHSRRNRPSPAG